MRRFHVPRGKYQGDHIIYDSIKEAEEAMPGVGIKRWRDLTFDNFDIGDWIEADDGFIVQILNRSRHQERKGTKYPNSDYVREDRVMMFVRFPVRMAIIKKLITRDRYYHGKLYAGISAIDNNSASYIFRSSSLNEKRFFICNGKNDYKKKHFGMLLGMGINPFEAYKIIGGKLNCSRVQTIEDISMLMADEMVRMEAGNMIKTFQKKVSEDPEFSDAAMLEYMKEFKKYVKKGSKTHLDSIPVLLKLTGKIAEDFGTINSGKQIPANTELEIPPI